jgi:hypothetical protein
MKTKNIFDGKEFLTALWVPGWYELDQSIAVGQVAEFCFYTDPPESLLQKTAAGGKPDHADLVFFNSLMVARNSRICKARVVSIEHPQLGSLRSIETQGLDYIFQKANGESVVVNAEEDPGAVRSDGFTQIDDWTTTVTLADVFCVDDT